VWFLYILIVFILHDEKQSKAFFLFKSPAKTYGKYKYYFIFLKNLKNKKLFFKLKKKIKLN